MALLRLYDEQVEEAIGKEFEVKAQKFWNNAKQEGFNIPYKQEDFIAVATIGWLIVKAGEVPTIERLKEAIKDYNQLNGKKIKQSQVVAIFRGDGLETEESWVRFRWEYLKKVLGSIEFHEHEVRLLNSKEMTQVLYQRGSRSARMWILLNYFSQLKIYDFLGGGTECVAPKLFL